MSAQFRAEAKLDAIALLVATLDRDCEGWSYLISHLKTREDALRALAGMTSIASALAEQAYGDPRELVAQWGALAAREIDVPNPPHPQNAEERRRRGKP